jgi:hypothetical protein
MTKAETTHEAHRALQDSIINGGSSYWQQAAPLNQQSAFSM